MNALRPNRIGFRSLRHREMMVAWGFLLPNFLGFLIFTVGPVLFSLAVSFSNWNLQRTVPFQWIGLGNFRELLHDREFWLYFINTVYLMLGMPVAIAGSLFLAILLSQRLRGIVVYRTLFYLPSFTSGVALLILWKALYNPRFRPHQRPSSLVPPGLSHQRSDGHAGKAAPHPSRMVAVHEEPAGPPRGGG
jgi:ABC-type sugar transport system permease subunit